MEWWGYHLWPWVRTTFATNSSKLDTDTLEPIMGIVRQTYLWELGSEGRKLYCFSPPSNYFPLFPYFIPSIEFGFWQRIWLFSFIVRFWDTLYGVERVIRILMSKDIFLLQLSGSCFFVSSFYCVPLVFASSVLPYDFFRFCLFC